MAVQHTEATRNAIADLVVIRIDAGAGAGVLEMRDVSEAVVATLTFTDPAFGGAAAGVATANPITDETSAAGGTIDHAVILDSNGVEVLRGSVTATGGGGDIELGSVVISAGQDVRLTSLTYTAPA